MNVVFYLDIDQEIYWRILRIAIASVRKCCPVETTITFLSPTWFVVKQPIDANRYLAVANLPKGTYYAHRRMIANSNVTVGDNLFLDVDMIMQQNVSNVFNYQFDIAVCKRDKVFDMALPYNGGVVFCRSKEFWLHCAVGFNKHTTNWRDAELAFNRVVQSPEYTRRDLDGTRYNRTSDNGDISGAAIVHYKGERKNRMLARAKEFGL